MRFAEKVFGSAYARGALMVALASSLWGFVCFSRKVLLYSCSPILLTALSGALTVATLFAIYRPKTAELKDTWAKHCWALLGLSLFGGLLGVAFFFLGFAKMDVGIANFIGKLQPLFVIAIAHVVLKERMPFKKVPLIFGCLLSGYLIVVPNPLSLDFQSAAIAGILWMLAGGACMAVSAVLGKHLMKHDIPVEHVVIFRFALSAACFPPLFVWRDSLGLLFEPTMDAAVLLMIATLTYVGGFIFYYRGLAKVPVSISSFLEQLTPLVAMCFGMIFLGEALSSTQMAGVPLLMCSLYGIQKA